jgi:hypothetical protein
VLPGDPEFVTHAHLPADAPACRWPEPHRYHVIGGCVQPTSNS